LSVSFVILAHGGVVVFFVMLTPLLWNENALQWRNYASYWRGLSGCDGGRSPAAGLNL